MKYIFITFCTLFVLPSAFAQKTDKSKSKAMQPQDNSHIIYRGAPITDEGYITTAELVEAMKENEQFETKVIANIVTCCQKKGCWMQVDLGNGELMRVTFKDYGFFMPMDCPGKTVIMQGIAFYDTIDVELLRHFAEDEGKSEAEIMTIKEPEKTLAFEAVGVILK